MDDVSKSRAERLRERTSLGNDDGGNLIFFLLLLLGREIQEVEVCTGGGGGVKLWKKRLATSGRLTKVQVQIQDY